MRTSQPYRGPVSGASQQYRGISASTDVPNFTITQGVPDYTEFDVKIKDYPDELQRAYEIAKAHNDLTTFNQAVDQYNLTQKNKAAEFKKIVDAPDYPAELKQAYTRSEETNDFTTFNQAVKEYNEKTGRQEQEIYNARLQEFNEGQQRMVQQREAAINRIAEDNGLTPAMVNEIVDLLKNHPNDPRIAASAANIGPILNDLAYAGDIPGATVQKVERQIYEEVGIDNARPEFLFKNDYDMVLKENPGLADTLKHKGLVAYNTTVKNARELSQADYETWVNENIKTDTYLHGILMEKGDLAALAAWDKRQTDLQKIYDRWINKNIKADSYLNGVLVTKGEQAALDAYDKRNKDLSGIYQRSQARFVKWLNTEAPEELKRAFKSGGEQSYNAAVTRREERFNAQMQELKDGGYVDKDGNIDTFRYLGDAGDVDRGLENSIAYQRLSDRLAAENRQVNQIEFNDLWEKEIAKVKREYKNQSIEQRARLLADIGVDNESIKEARYYANQTGAQKMWQGMTPWDEYKGETATVGGALHMGADLLVPFYYTATHWNELSPAARTVGILLDAATVALPAIAVAKAGGAAARTVGTASRAERFLAAFRVGGQTAVREALGPFNIVVHPIASSKFTKNAIRNFGRWLLKPSHMEEAVVTNATGQKILTAADFGGNLKLAEEAGNKLAERMRNGERLFVEVGDKATGIYRVEIRPSLLQKEIGTIASHATTDLAPFEQGLKVEYQSGKPINEQGLFVAPDPVTEYTLHSASGGGAIPIPTEAGGTAEKVWYYKPEDIARMDADPIRPIKFSYAKNVPADLAEDIETIVKKYNGRISGSLNTYVKVPRAKVPNDIDAVFVTSEIARQAQDEIVNLAKSKGYNATKGVGKRDVLIDGKSIIDCDAAIHHDAMIPKEYIQKTAKIDGYDVEKLGEQYIRQSYGAVSGTKKAKRIKSVDKMAPVLHKLLKSDEAAVLRKPGAAIWSGTSRESVEPVDKLFYYKHPKEYGWVKEIEGAAKVNSEMAPVTKQLTFSTGPRGIVVQINMDKPLTLKQWLKLKTGGFAEDLKAPFQPAITVKKMKGAVAAETGVSGIEVKESSITGSLSGKTKNNLTLSDVKRLARDLLRNGNITSKQASNIIRASALVGAIGSRAEKVFARQEDIPEEKDRGRVKREENPRGKVKVQDLENSRMRARETVERGSINPRGIGSLERGQDVTGRGRSENANVSSRGIGQTRTVPTRSSRDNFRVDDLSAPISRVSVRPSDNYRERIDLPRAGNEPVTRIPPGRDERIPPEPPRYKPPPPVPPPPVPPDDNTGGITLKGKTDKEKREIIRSSKGATTYNMGKLHGKDVWWTKIDGQKQPIVVLGEKPEGARFLADGPGSVEKTSQRIGSPDFKPFSIRHGAVVSHVVPQHSAKGATTSFGPAFPTSIGRSRKLGKMHITQIGGGIGLSRHAIKRRNHR